MLGLRTLVGTGSRQRNISQSQASLEGNVTGGKTGVEPSGGNIPVTYFTPMFEIFFISLTLIFSNAASRLPRRRGYTYQEGDRGEEGHPEPTGGAA